MGYEDLQRAVVNRSLRSVKTELDFLVDANIITSAQHSAIINNLPAENALPAEQPRAAIAPVVVPVASPSPAPTPALGQMNLNNNNNNEKNGYYGAQAPNVPPPAYPSAPPAPSALATATALYQYNAQDAGDLQLSPNDRIIVTEYMNAEWWKGRNEKTGHEGIFPRSYVKVIDEKGPPMMPAVPTHQPSNYGNMPLDVSQSGSAPPQQAPGQPSKLEQGGKKFGKKLGNAAIFGAGATIGGNIVNSIF